MNRFKRIISECLILLMVFYVWETPRIAAVSACRLEENNAHVDELFGKLSDRELSDKEIEDVCQELSDLGYEKIETGGNAAWYKNVAAVPYNGVEYIVETYRAVPGNEKSNLACWGEVSKTSKGENIEKYYRYDIQTNVIFKFVKKKRSDADTKLSLVANMTTGHVSSLFGTIRTTGLSYTKDYSSDKKDIGIWKVAYSDIDAIKYFLEESTRNQFFCDTITVKGPDGQRVLRYSPLAPVTTAQVF